MNWIGIRFWVILVISILIIVVVWKGPEIINSWSQKQEKAAAQEEKKAITKEQMERNLLEAADLNRKLTMSWDGALVLTTPAELIEEATISSTNAKMVAENAQKQLTSASDALSKATGDASLQSAFDRAQERYNKAKSAFDEAEAARKNLEKRFPATDRDKVNLLELFRDLLGSWSSVHSLSSGLDFSATLKKQILNTSNQVDELQRILKETMGDDANKADAARKRLSEFRSKKSETGEAEPFKVLLATIETMCDEKSDQMQKDAIACAQGLIGAIDYTLEWMKDPIITQAKVATLQMYVQIAKDKSRSLLRGLTIQKMNATNNN